MNDAPEIFSHPAAPGVLGALIAALIGLKFIPGETWVVRALELVQRGFSFAAGSCIAIYGGPAAVEFFSIKTEGLTAFMIFTVGLVGFSLAKAIISGIKEIKFGEIFSGYLTALRDLISPKG